MSFTRFIRKYYTMEQRIKIISDPKKCSVSHIYENRELNQEEVFMLFADYDYAMCEKNFYDLEQYLQIYGDLVTPSVIKAKNEIINILFKNPSKTVLINYVKNFPNGIYHQQAKELLAKDEF